MPPKEATQDKPLILLVEDDGFLRDIFSRKLSSNFGIKSTDNGEEAISIIIKDAPALVLLDLNLPEESGFDILRKIRENDKIKDTLVFILTNSVLSEDLKTSNELHADDFITKADFTLDEIIEKIEKHLSSKILSKK